MVTAKNYVKLYTTIDLEAALSPQFIPSFTRKDKTNKRVTGNQFSWIIQIYDWNRADTICSQFRTAPDKNRRKSDITIVPPQAPESVRKRRIMSSSNLGKICTESPNKF